MIVSVAPNKNVSGSVDEIRPVFLNKNASLSLDKIRTLFLYELASISLDEFLQREQRSQPESNVWSVLVMEPSDFDEVLEDLTSGIEIFVECEVGVVSGDGGARKLCDRIVACLADYLVLCNFESWLSEDWRQIDSLRGCFNRKKLGGVLVLSPDSAKAMVANAPNFFSWLNPRFYSLNVKAEFLTAEECEKRLSAFREWFGQSDAEIIALAEAKKLPPEPAYGEWLVLLDRGDLIAR